MSRLAARFTMVLLLVLTGMETRTAQAEAFPAQPVKIIIQAAIGNGPDIAARIFADRFSELWGQQVLVVNRPGAGGMMAAQAAASARPDGYTLYVPGASTFLVLPVTHPKLPFDLTRDFRTIGLLYEAPIIIAVAPSLGVTSLPELLDHVRQRASGMFFAASSPGTLPHLTGELFRRRAALALTYVPYPGTTQALQDIMGGRVAIIVDGLGALSEAIRIGAVRPLAITSPTRLPHLPDLPTVSETLPEFITQGWFPVLAPAGTPEPVVRKLSADLQRILAQPGLRDRLALLGATLRPMDPPQVAEFIEAERARWKPLVDEVAADLR